MNEPIIIAGIFMSVVGVITILVTNYMQNHNDKTKHTHQ